MSEAPQFRKLSVLMPVYNERWTLEIIVGRVLSSPVDVELELVIVDDCSTDGSWELIQALAQDEPRIQAVRHAENGGKGTAIRTAIAHMTGDVAVVQDADLEYDPHEFPRLLAPILAGKADAVFGSRYAGAARRVPRYWHTQVNRFLTFVSNLCSGLMLTDMETCYKMVRADVLRRLHLTSATFTLEPEITLRLAQCGARVYEVPISYAGRSFDEGKKIRPIDGLKALGALARYRFFDRRFSTDDAFVTLTTFDRATRINQALRAALHEHLGQRMVHLGCGLGTLAGTLLSKERLVLADADRTRTELLTQRFARRANLSIEHASADDSNSIERWRRMNIDTILITDWLGQGLDQQALAGCRDALAAGGKLVVCTPATDNDNIAAELRRCDYDVSLSQDLVCVPRWLARLLPRDPARRVRAVNRAWPLLRLVSRPSGTGMFRLVVAHRRELQLRRLAA